MFVRKKKNISGSTSVQIISNHYGKYKLIKTIGCSKNCEEVKRLVELGKNEIKKLCRQNSIFDSNTQRDMFIEQFISDLSNTQIRVYGPELIYGKIFDFIGYSSINDELFKHLVVARLAFPLSKLKTIDYIFRYQGILIDKNKIYRFLDKLSDKYKNDIEQISFSYLKKLRGKNLKIVFYDMTTLHFETSDQDDLRITGFSKCGKHQNPQIFLGLLVDSSGYPIGYDIFEGNTYKGSTLIPFIEKMQKKFNLDKPTIIADSGLLSKSNIKSLTSKKYTYIIGARIKSETKELKSKILEENKKYSGEFYSYIIPKEDQKLIIGYSLIRAKKDKKNREKGLKRLEEKIKGGKLTKSNINNRGYNKYLKMKGDVKIEIDYTKFNLDEKWDGLKGYITNSKIEKEEIIKNYNNLWVIERAFRISKTDLKIRPIYHRLRNRIESHICISFTSYMIYKELERVLKKENSKISLEESSDLIKTIYQIAYVLPDSKKEKKLLLKMCEKQTELIKIIQNYF